MSSGGIRSTFLLSLINQINRIHLCNLSCNLIGDMIIDQPEFNVKVLVRYKKDTGK